MQHEMQHGGKRLVLRFLHAFFKMICAICKFMYSAFLLRQTASSSSILALRLLWNMTFAIASTILFIFRSVESSKAGEVD
jgi:hypothetical protein